MKLHFIKSLFILGLSVSFAGCLKDKAFDNGEIQSGAGDHSTIKAISIGLTVSNTSNFLVVAYDNSSNDTTIGLIPVTLGATKPAQQDIHVTLTANPTLIDDYNTANGTTYSVPPAALFTVLNGGIVTIPKGGYTGYLQVSFKPSDFLGVTYAVGYTISAVTESGYTISNLNNGIVAIAIKNEWDGDYDVTGWFFHPAAGRAINTTKHLSTVSAIGLQGGVGDLGSPFTFDVVGNQLTNWFAATFSGSFTSSGFMTADNPGGTDYSSPTNGGHVPGDADFNSTIYNNTYDPATKTFYMHYGYVANVAGGESVYTRQVYEKWVRQ